MFVLFQVSAVGTPLKYFYFSPSKQLYKFVRCLYAVSTVFQQRFLDNRKTCFNRVLTLKNRCFNGAKKTIFNGEKKVVSTLKTRCFNGVLTVTKKVF